MPIPKLPTTWLLLGRDPLLSAGEILSLLSRERIIYENPVLQSPFLFISADLKAEIIHKLGGTIKIAEEIGANLSEAEMIDAMQSKLSTTTNKIIFGISFYGEDRTEDVERWGKELKKALKTDGHSVRYVFNRESTLSSVTVEKNSLIDKGFEFLVLKTPGGYRLARTIAVQPFESFSSRDYGRPSRDSESGMLPPKLAMMLINLSETPLDGALLDPFCGSGTIISEALLLGYQKVYGTDASEKAVADSNKNISWLLENNEKVRNASWKIDLVPAQNLSGKFASGSIAGIATEPYLGRPKNGRESSAELVKEAGELAELYLSAFEQFKKILQPRAHVVFIIPRFIIKSGPPITISDKLLPELKKIGFSADFLLPQSASANDGWPTKSSFLYYQRPGQYVGREIWRFSAS